MKHEVRRISFAAKDNSVSLGDFRRAVDRVARQGSFSDDAVVTFNAGIVEVSEPALRRCCSTQPHSEHRRDICPKWVPDLTVEEVAHLRATILRDVKSA